MNLAFQHRSQPNKRIFVSIYAASSLVVARYCGKFALERYRLPEISSLIGLTGTIGLKDEFGRHEGSAVADLQCEARMNIQIVVVTVDFCESIYCTC